LALGAIIVASLEPTSTPTPAHASAPGAPVAADVHRPGGVSGTTATVRWTQAPTGTPATSYVVHAVPHDGDPTTTTPTATVTLAAGDRAPAAVLTGLTPGVHYDITVTSVTAGGTATVVANPTTWQPSPADGLALWLDASHPDTVTASGGQLASLLDRSDAGNDPVLTTQPWSATGGYRGRAVTWGFPGLSNTDTAAGTIVVPHHTTLNHNGTYTIVMAVHQTTAIYPIYAQFVIKATFLDLGRDCYATQYQLAKFTDPSELYGYIGGDVDTCSSFVRQNRSGIAATGDQVIGRRVRFEAGVSQSEFLRDGEWDATPSIAGRTPDTTASLSLTTPHMSEMMVFTTALSDATVSAIRAYLGAKVPLPAPTVSAVTPRDDGLDVAFEPGHGTDVLAAGRYQVSLDGGASWQERHEGYADSPMRLGGMAPGTTVTVSVRAVSSVGYGAASPAVVATVPVPVSVSVPAPDVASVLPLTTQPIPHISTAPPQSLAPPVTSAPRSIPTPSTSPSLHWWQRCPWVR
jgi:hypothetical protein